MAAIKIGELLIREGLITPAELEEALKAQVIFGGRLGTNLIEMGLLEEDDIARVLSRKLKVPFIEPAELMEIPQQVLALLPRELAERHKAIPLRLEGRRLTLAMTNPADLPAVDEIAFRTGLIIRPVVAPELRLIQALEKHYQVARDLRFISVDRNLPARGRKRTEPPKEEVPPQTHEPEVILDLEEIAGSAETLLPDHLSLDAVARRLGEAGSRDDIADLAIAWAGARFRQTALFLVRGESALGWRGMAEGRLLPAFERLRIPLAEPSALKTVAESRSWFLGPLPPSPFNSLFLRELGGEIPPTALLLPLLMMGRTIAILYVDGEDAVLRKNLQNLQNLVIKMVMAFEILILKNKIVMT